MHTTNNHYFLRIVSASIISNSQLGGVNIHRGMMMEYNDELMQRKYLNTIEEFSLYLS